ESRERERRRARLPDAGAHHRRTALLYRARDRERLPARLDRARAGDERERLRADDVAVDLERRVLALTELAARELVGTRDRHDPVDARHHLEAELGDPGRIADGADRGRQLARHDDHVNAGRLEPSDDGVDLLLRGAGGHDDHHLAYKLSTGRSSGLGLAA